MILVFGDSITQGYYDTQGGWVARLFGMLVKKYGVDAQGVFNLGISGDNASKIKARFNFDVSSRVRNRDDSIIFDFGINDSDQKAGKFASTPEQFARDIKELGDIARKYVDNVIFMNITPVDDQRVQPTAWNGELYYNNERIGQFNAVLDEYITAGGGVMIDVHTPFSVAQAKQDLLIDGAHPNDVGHKLIADVVMKRLEEILR